MITKPKDISFRVGSWANYVLNAQSHLYLHAPFAYHLVSDVLYDRQSYPAYNVLEQLLTNQHNDSTTISFKPVGAKSSGKTINSTVSQLSKQFALPLKHAKLLVRLVQHFKPNVILETGTGTGLSSAALALRNSSATVYTIDAISELTDVATKHHQAVGIKNVQYESGLVDDVLPTLISKIAPIDFVFLDANHTYDATLAYFQLLLPHLSPTACIVVDDIHWNRDMKKAWLELTRHPSITTSMDLYRLGLLFVDKGLNRTSLRVYF